MQQRKRSDQGIRRELKQGKRVKLVHFLLLCVDFFFAAHGKEIFSLKPETIGGCSLIYCLLRKQSYTTVFTQLYKAGRLPGQL